MSSRPTACSSDVPPAERPGGLRHAGPERVEGRAGALESHDGPAANPDDVPSGRRSSRWSAHDSGFNIHAGVRVPAGNHIGRPSTSLRAGEQLCRYVTRPPFAMDRFSGCPTVASPTASVIRWVPARRTA